MDRRKRRLRGGESHYHRTRAYLSVKRRRGVQMCIRDRIKAAAKANGIDVDEDKSADLAALQLRQRQIQMLRDKPAA